VGLVEGTVRRLVVVVRTPGLDELVERVMCRPQRIRLQVL